MKPRLARRNRTVLMSFATATHPFAVGELRITALSRSHGANHHTALLAIRTGRGRHAHDRIHAFEPAFQSRESALMYAAVQGRYWLLNPASMA